MGCSPLKVYSVWYLPHVGFFHGLFFDPVDGINIYLQNNGRLPMRYMALYPRRRNSSFISSN
jgi:hypothetical protein